MSRTRSQGRVHPLLLAAVAVAFATCGYLAARHFSEASQPTGLASESAAASALRAYPQPRVIADFALTDKRGQPYSLADWQGHDTLVFFGFTFCPDICPGTLGQLSTLRDRLIERGIGEEQLQIHFISVDPERDTPEMLGRYVDYFDPAIRAATGPHPQLAALTRQLGILYSIEAHEPEDKSYQVDHSASVLLVDSQGRLAGAFPAPLDPDAMVEALVRRLTGET